MDIYGFDYDYTLAMYSNALDAMIYNKAREFLIEHYKVRLHCSVITVEQYSQHNIHISLSMIIHLYRISVDELCRVTLEFVRARLFHTSFKRDQNCVNVFIGDAFITDKCLFEVGSGKIGNQHAPHTTPSITLLILDIH